MMTLAVLPLLTAAQDTVAYVAQRGGPPATETYMWAGYAVALLCFGGYIALLARRVTRSTRGE